MTRPRGGATHTLALLEIDGDEHDALAERLKAAGYDHAFDVDSEKGVIIDMTGVGLVSSSERGKVARLHHRIARLKAGLQTIVAERDVDLLRADALLLIDQDEKLASEPYVAPVQGDPLTIKKGHPGHHPGTVSWEEHDEAWREYAGRHGGDQSARRIAERGGFGYRELTIYLGRTPTTWRPR